MKTIKEVSEVMLNNKFLLIKNKISTLADKHEYYMGISAGSGSKATEIIEAQQLKLYELLNKITSNIKNK